jgi:hypothetical protein
MSDGPRRRRSSWLKSQSDSFGPIKQVSLGVSIGFPLLVVGVLMLVLLIVSWVGGTTFLWVLAAGLLVAGVLAAASGRVF